MSGNGVSRWNNIAVEDNTAPHPDLACAIVREPEPIAFSLERRFRRGKWPSKADLRSLYVRFRFCFSDLRGSDPSSELKAARNETPGGHRFDRRSRRESGAHHDDVFGRVQTDAGRI